MVTRLKITTKNYLSVYEFLYKNIEAVVLHTSTAQGI